MTCLDLKRALGGWITGEFAPPIARTLGVVLRSAESGRAVAELTIRPELFNAMGTLHGGIFCDVADAAIGAALASVAQPDESFTTVELSIHYFSPLTEGILHADAVVVRRGKRVGYAECSLTTTSRELVAKVSSTCLFNRR